MVRSILHPILAAGLAAFMACGTEGCIPPGGQAMEDAYKAEIKACVANAATTQESCLCRVSVDEKYGLCDHPSWPRLGRCDYRCE